jgi:hypothetical protein
VEEGLETGDGAGFFVGYSVGFSVGRTIAGAPPGFSTLPLSRTEGALLGIGDGIT